MKTLLILLISVLKGIQPTYLPIQTGKFFYMDFTEDDEGIYYTKVMVGVGEP